MVKTLIAANADVNCVCKVSYFESHAIIFIICIFTLVILFTSEI